MKTAICTLESISPYSQSKHHDVPKEPKENSNDYELRTWRFRLHTDDDGIVYIPPMAFKNCLSECAKYLSMQIEGKSKHTYTKHFEAGVIVSDEMKLGIKASEVKAERLFLNSDGKRGSGRRVWKYMPLIPKWSGKVTFYIFDDIITETVFEQHLGEAGRFIGIGRFRPRNNGFYGRFVVKGIEWK